MAQCKILSNSLARIWHPKILRSLVWVVVLDQFLISHNDIIKNSLLSACESKEEQMRSRWRKLFFGELVCTHFPCLKAFPTEWCAGFIFWKAKSLFIKQHILNIQYVIHKHLFFKTIYTIHRKVFIRHMKYGVKHNMQKNVFHTLIYVYHTLKHEKQAFLATVLGKGNSRKIASHYKNLWIF